MIHPEITARFQADLLPGESFHWTGQPNPKVVLHKQDMFLIPFSLMWGGFALFWEAGVLGLTGVSKPQGEVSWFMALWGVPFVVIGQYLIWGRFLHAAWKKKRTYYAVTDRRVLACAGYGKQRLAAAFINALPVIEKDIRSDGIGTVSFGSDPAAESRRGMDMWHGLSITGVPVLLDIDDAQIVYSLISQLRDAAHSSR